MNDNILSLFGRMFPDSSHPALVQAADAVAALAAKSPEPTTKSASFAEAIKFVGEFYRHIEARTSSRSFPRLGQSGIMECGDFLTLSTSEWPSAEEGSSVCSLAAILEREVASKYYLSAKACAGILRRAEKRGKTLPETLRLALTQVAMATTTGATRPTSQR